MTAGERRWTIGLVVAGVAFVALAFAIVAWSGARVDDAFVAAQRVDTVTLERALDETIGGIDPTIAATVVGILGLLAIAATIRLTSAAQFGFGVATFLVVAIVLWIVNTALDYGTCDRPGFNDASAGRVLADRLSIALAVAWPAVVIAATIARLAIARRHVLLHALLVVTVAIGGAVLILFVGVADLC